MLKPIIVFSLCTLSRVLANDAIPENYFTDINGELAADAGSPYVYISTITSCLPKHLI